MFSQALPTSPSGHERSLSSLANGKQPVVGGSLRKGMDRLVKVIERRVDRQILAAQIRAYDTSSVSSAKSHHS